MRGRHIIATYSRDDFPGPSASWVNEDELVYEHELRQAAALLADNLRQRISTLEQPDISIEILLDEIRRQIANCAVDGHVTVAADLSDLALSLVTAREGKNRSR